MRRDSGETPREIRVPKPVHVHVEISGLDDPRPDAWLHGPDVVSLEPDDRTGWARLDGVVQPGWKAFDPAEGQRVEVSPSPPFTLDVTIPRGRPVALDLSAAGTTRRAVLRAEGEGTVELEWARLEPPPKAVGSWSWSLTREGLDDPGPGSAAPARPAK